MNMNDSLLMGLIKITDNKTGEVIREVHNMVVDAGRNWILNKINPNGTADTRKIYWYFISSDINETTRDYTKNNFSDNKVINKINLEDSNKATFEAANSNVDRPYVKISIDVKEITELSAIGSIGLIFSNAPGGSDTAPSSNYEVFSRAIFDPIILNEDSDFTVTYYMYI